MSDDKQGNIGTAADKVERVELPRAKTLRTEATPQVQMPQVSARAKRLGVWTPGSERVAAPELVPIRMCAEALFCERSMYMEWAQGEFADNHYTEDGRRKHRRVDKKKKGKLPAKQKDEPQEESKPYEAKSVWLSSEKLGLTGIADVVAVSEDGDVMPVEYKRGKDPSKAYGVPLSHRVQVAAQVMLLREHGYACDEGALYYAESKNRVPVKVDDQLVEIVKHAVHRVRELTSKTEVPPPLKGSPKCYGCSLAGICLPDETNLLRETVEGREVTEEDDRRRELEELPVFARPEPTSQPEPDPWGLKGIEELQDDRDVRRLLPARDDKVPLLVQEQGARIGVSGQSLVVKRRTGPAEQVKLPLLSQVSIFGNVQVSTQALKALFNRGIPLQFFSYGGWYIGRTMGMQSKNIELRVAQVHATEDEELCLELARGFVNRKLKNSRTMLRRNGEEVPADVLNSLKMAARKAAGARRIDELLGIEGAGAREYFGHFNRMLKGEAAEQFEMNGRNRRPPKDPVNALLSFAYALLTKEWTRALDVVGLDPMLGFYHQLRFGRVSLALDMMEEFRPLVADSVVIRVLNERVLEPDDFETTGIGVSLGASGRKRFLQAFERRMNQLVRHPVFGYKISYRRVLEVQARLMTRVVLGEIDEYPGFTTR